MSNERHDNSPPGRAATPAHHPDRYKWIALSNTTIGMLMATINGSILLIALPNIFRGIKLNPLAPSNTSYFLWILMGFLLVTSVLVVSLGRVGDMFGRVRMYTLGFAVFTVFSILLAATWMTGPAGALWIIVMRIGQGVGGAFLFANSSAIITDAFPADERGLALGINAVAAIGGSFLGLILGGLLAPVQWHLVFLVSVPFGLFGTVWAYAKLRDNGRRVHARIDWTGNITFAVGLVGVLTGIVYGLQPYGGHTMGWTSPFVLACLIGGAAVLVAFVVIELHVDQPMFRLHLFRSRPFAMGNVAALLGALARGGLQFMLIIWLQGIWLPLHGVSFQNTPLQAGIDMVPMMLGFLVMGPVSGALSDRFGARGFGTAGLLCIAAAFYLLTRLPADFHYWPFAAIIFLMGVGMGLFTAPNTTAVMNALPSEHRGSGSGMRATFQNSASMLSMGVFFTIVIIGLSHRLPGVLDSGLRAAGLPTPVAAGIAHLPPTAALFAAFLGYNPMGSLLPHTVLSALPRASAANLLSLHFFPHLIAPAFMTGLADAFYISIAMALVAAVASLLRGPRYIHENPVTTADDKAAGNTPAAEAIDGQHTAATEAANV